jgi:hypothetical protein
MLVVPTGRRPELQDRRPSQWQGPKVGSQRPHGQPTTRGMTWCWTEKLELHDVQTELDAMLSRAHANERCRLDGRREVCNGGRVFLWPAV